MLFILVFVNTFKMKNFPASWVQPVYVLLLKKHQSLSLSSNFFDTNTSLRMRGHPVCIPGTPLFLSSHDQIPHAPTTPSLQQLL